LGQSGLPREPRRWAWNGAVEGAKARVRRQERPLAPSDPAPPRAVKAWVQGGESEASRA
jgi:hypothetical protein